MPWCRRDQRPTAEYEYDYEYEGWRLFRAAGLRPYSPALPLLALFPKSRPATADRPTMSTLSTPPTTAPPASPTGPPPPPGQRRDAPLSQRELDELADAQRRARKLLGAARLANFNGWTTGIFAALSLLFGIASPSALVMGLLLALVAFNELRGRRLLLRFDLRGPRTLALNQLLLMGVLIGYSLWRIHGALTDPSPYEAAVAATPELASMLEPVGRLYTRITLAIYGALIAFSAIFQGLAAAYYLRCARRVQAHLQQTPPWITDAQRTWAGGR